MGSLPDERPTDPLRDWLVTFAHKLAVERDYSARHPGHRYCVMLNRDEAEGLMQELDAWKQDAQQLQGRLAELAEGRFSPECDCCREAARIVSGNRQWPK